MRGSPAVAAQESPIKPAWQRWNDYGIGCYLEGGPGMKKGELRQAEVAFKKLLTLGVPDAVPHGHTNLARVAIDLGDLKAAADHVTASGQCDPPAPWWLRAWLSGVATAENASGKADWDAAAAEFAKIVDPANQPRERNMDFTKDYVVLGRLGQAYYRRSQQEPSGSAAQREFLLKAVGAYVKALAVDPEDLFAHDGLNRAYAALAVEAPAGGGKVDGTAAEVERLSVSATVGGAAERVTAAVALADAVAALGRKPPDARAPRLKPLQEARVRLQKSFAAEKDEPTRAALAIALSTLHRELHALFLPDELAQSLTAQKYRKAHPAAAAAANAIVIYPTKMKND